MLAAIRGAMEQWLRTQGVSVLLNSHLLSEVELVCDRVTILLGGEVVAAGTPAQLSRPRGVELETDEGVRMIAGATREDAPRLVAEAIAAGRRGDGTTLDYDYLVIATGPEGGFAEEEVELARTAGFAIVGLGPRILRSETVAVAVAAAILSRTGDFA